MRGRRDDAVVDRRARAAEQVAAVAERVGREPHEVLAVVGEQREVVRDDVGGEDRDQRVRELERGRRGGSVRSRGMPRARRPRSGRRARPSTSRPIVKPSSSARAGPKPRPPKKSCRCGSTSLNSGPSLAPSNAVTPMPATSTAAMPATRSSRPAPTTGGRSVQRAVAPRERRERGEQAEVDAERVGVAGPRLDAVEAHPDEHRPRRRPASSTASGAGRARCPSTARRCRSRRCPAAAGQRPSRSG